MMDKVLKMDRTANTPISLFTKLDTEFLVIVLMLYVTCLTDLFLLLAARLVRHAYLVDEYYTYNRVMAPILAVATAIICMRLTLRVLHNENRNYRRLVVMLIGFSLSLAISTFMYATALASPLSFGGIAHCL